jgi:hypothetical protein
MRTVAQALRGSVVNVKEDKSLSQPVLTLSSGQSVSGYAPVLQVLAPFIDPSAPDLQGRRAAILLSFAAILAFLYSEVGRKYALLATLPAMFALFAQGSGCVTCGNFTQGLLAVVPLVGLALIGILTALLLFGPLSDRMFRAIAFVIGFVPVGQAMLLCIEPRLCWACITFGTCTSFIAQGLATGAPETAIRVLVPPRSVANGMLAICGLAIVRLSLAATNVAPLTHPEPGRTNYISHPFSTYVKKKMPAGAYIVTSIGCTACEAAKVAIKLQSLPITEIPVCTVFSQNACFDPGSDPIGTPTILVVNRSGVVTWQRVGWPSSMTEQADLMREIDIYRSEP